MNPSTRHLLPRSGGSRRDLPSGARIHRQDKKKVLSYRFSNTPPGNCLWCPPADSALDQSRRLRGVTSRTDNRSDVRASEANESCGILEIHRGLTSHEEPARLAEVFADDE